MPCSTRQTVVVVPHRTRTLPHPSVSLYLYRGLFFFYENGSMKGNLRTLLVCFHLYRNYL